MTSPFFFIFLLGLALGGFLVWLALGGRRLKEGLVEKRQVEKEKNKQRILAYLAAHPRLTNNEVEKLLGVSDATAERYLRELEKIGLIKQVGRTGQSVFYERR